MAKKSYHTPVLEVVEIGFGALHCASDSNYPIGDAPAGISKHEDWVTGTENDYDI